MSWIVSIEGNIGAGKSVLIKEMRKYYEMHKNYDTTIFLKLHVFNIIVYCFIYNAAVISLEFKSIIKYIIITLCCIVWHIYDYYKTENEKKRLPNVIFLEEPLNIWQSIKDKFGKNILELYYTDPKKYAFVFQMLCLYTRMELIERHKTNEETIIIIERSIYSDHLIFEKMLYNTDIMNDVEDIVYKLWFDCIANDMSKIDQIYLKSDPKNTYERKNIRNRSEEENVTLEYLTLCHEYHEDMIANTNPLMVIEIDKYNIADKPKYKKMVKSIFTKLYSDYK